MIKGPSLLLSSVSSSNQSSFTYPASMPSRALTTVTMLDRILSPHQPSIAHGTPLVSRICRSYTAHSSTSHQPLQFETEELVYALSAPKHGWILVKKMDPASSLVVWVPHECLSEPQTGPYRAKVRLTEHEGQRIRKGEILQVTRMYCYVSFRGYSSPPYH